MYHLYHGEPNTGSLKVLMILHEAGAVFESHWLDFTNPQVWCGEPFCRSHHWNIGVEIGSPLLLDGDVLLSDSALIGYYVDERSAEPHLLLHDAHARWYVGKWIRFSAETLTPAVHTLGCAQVSAPLQRAQWQQALSALTQAEHRQQWQQWLQQEYPDALLDDCRRRIHLAVSRVEHALGEQLWLAGDELTLADIDIFTGLRAAQFLMPAGFDADTSPHVQAWLQRIAERPSFSAALAYSKSSAPELAFAPGPENSRWG